MAAAETIGRAARAGVAAGPATIRDAEGKRLVADCLAGDAAARARFQQEFGALIYRFAAYAGGFGRSEPGDFYVYLFEDDRVYRRLRSYEGRASLGPFLRGYVLPDLFKQFQSMIRKETLPTVSLDTDCEREPAAASPSVSDQTASPSPIGGADPGSAGLLTQLSREKRLLVKLLYIEDFDLDADDVRLLAERSVRPVREVIKLVEQARQSVRSREVARREKLDEAESAAQWILQYERRLAQLSEDLGNLPPESGRAERLRHQQAEIERKSAWRQRQRERALKDSQRATVTLRYREIAHILNAPVGSVSAQVTRLRQELLNLAAQHAGHRDRIR